MKNLFTKHLQSVGESYSEHFKHAMIFSGNMFIGSIACLLHAIFPFLFEKTGSNVLFKALHIYINRMPAPEPRLLELAACIEKKCTAVEK